MKQFKLLGVKLQTMPEHVAKSTLLDFLQSDKQHQIATVNAEFIVRCQKDKKFADIINQASLATIDGSGPIKALQFLGEDVSLDDRLTGVRLTEILIDIAVNNNYKILFCLYSKGLTKPDRLFMNLKDKYPSLDYQVADEKTALEKARLFAPQIVLVGFGAPRQDMWINKYMSEIPSIKIAAGVGGTFDFMSGKIKRAPKIFRSLGIESIFRMIQQPFQDLSGTSQRFRRIIRALIVFPYLIIKNRYINNKKIK